MESVGGKPSQHYFVFTNNYCYNSLLETTDWIESKMIGGGEEKHMVSGFGYLGFEQKVSYYKYMCLCCCFYLLLSVLLLSSFIHNLLIIYSASLQKGFLWLIPYVVHCIKHFCHLVNISKLLDVVIDFHAFQSLSVSLLAWLYIE